MVKNAPILSACSRWQLALPETPRSESTTKWFLLIQYVTGVRTATIIKSMNASHIQNALWINHPSFTNMFSFLPKTQQPPKRRERSELHPFRCTGRENLSSDSSACTNEALELGKDSERQVVKILERDSLRPFKKSGCSRSAERAGRYQLSRRFLVPVNPAWEP